MKKYNIIIVENDEDERVFMKEGFDAANLFNIFVQLRNGDELFNWINENPHSIPDLVLSDLNMPGKNGYDIIKALKELPGFQQIPVIITSTSSTASIINKCLALGAYNYIVKPDTFIEYKPYAQKLHSLMLQRENK